MREGTLKFVSDGQEQSFTCQLEEHEQDHADVCTIFYEETAEEGEGIRNALELLPDGRIRLTRSGAVSAEFVFTEGEETAAAMHTPYGSLSFTVSTSEASVTKNRQQIGILLCYRLLEAPEEVHEILYSVTY